jgi:hypothetical protein
VRKKKNVSFREKKTFFSFDLMALIGLYHPLDGIVNVVVVFHNTEPKKLKEIGTSFYLG